MVPLQSHGREIARAFGWFFAALSMVALLSQPGASHDELNFHAPSIWCAQGVRDEYCSELDYRAGSVYEAYTNIGFSPCKVEADKPLVCPPNRDGWDGTLSNKGLYPSGYFFLLSWLVLPSVEVSFALLRVTSALVLSATFFLTMWLVSPRHRMVLFLLSLTVFPSTGMFLFASINPSSWTAFGVGIGWLAVHASLENGIANLRRRLLLLSLGLISWILALVSRIDAMPFIAFTVIVVLTFEFLARLSKSRTKAVLVVTICAIVLTIVAELYSPLPPIEHVQSLFRFLNDGLGSEWLISEGLVTAIPNALASLGTVPTHSAFHIPEVIYLGNLAVLSVIFARTYNSANKSQLLGVVVTVLAITFACISQVNLIGNRSTGSEPRYVYPLFLFAVGWWYLNSHADLNTRVMRLLRPSAALITGSFALWVYVVAERYVDRQTGGIRVLPEGQDEWWWSWMPFGPNIVVLLAPLFLWRYFRTMISILNSSSELVLSA